MLVALKMRYEVRLASRHGRRSTIATSQLPIDQWHGVIGDTTLADAILDRLMRFLGHRIGDKRILRLINKWLRVTPSTRGNGSILPRARPKAL